MGGTTESRIQREYEPVQPTYAQSTTRIRKPTLDEMRSAANRPVPRRDGTESGEAAPRAKDPSADRPLPPGGGGTGRESLPARDASIDPRTRAGAYGEKIRGPHKPTYDEMGPHAERGLPADGPRPPKPARTVDVPEDTAKKKHRHGRPRKTGRPGQ